VQISDYAGDFPVDFFGERRPFIPASKAGFHVTDFNLIIIGSQGCGHHGCRIPLNQYPIRFSFQKNLIHLYENRSRDIRQCLIFCHQVQIDIRRNAENLKHLIKHFSMLSREADDRFDMRFRLKTFNDGCHFNRFRTGAYYHHHFQPVVHNGYLTILFFFSILSVDPNC